MLKIIGILVEGVYNERQQRVAERQQMVVNAI